MLAAGHLRWGRSVPTGAPSSHRAQNKCFVWWLLCQTCLNWCASCRWWPRRRSRPPSRSSRGRRCARSLFSSSRKRQRKGCGPSVRILVFLVNTIFCRKTSGTEERAVQNEVYSSAGAGQGMGDRAFYPSSSTKQ